MTMLTTEALSGIYLVPGLPHIIQKADVNDGYAKLKLAMEDVGQDILASGAKRIIYYSTQWLAVLDQMFQAKSDLKGFHVDENWYEFGKLEFDFNIDQRFAEKMADTVQRAGHKTRLVDFNGFPVDTGSIVADTLVNPNKLPTAIVANNVYCDYENTRNFAALLCEALEQDGTPTALVAISGLSGRYFTHPIDMREDTIRESSDDKWNQTMLNHWAAGEFDNAEAKIPQFAKEARVDMGFKAYAFLRGFVPEGFSNPAKVLGYSAIYGTGGAVVNFASRPL